MLLYASKHGLLTEVSHAGLPSRVTRGTPLESVIRPLTNVHVGRAQLLASIVLFYPPDCTKSFRVALDPHVIRAL